MKSWKEKVIRVQDQGSGLVVLNTDNYVKKKEQKINKSSFDKLDKHKVIDWIEKWSDKVNKSWKEFIKPGNWNGGKMFGMVKTHKVDNPVRVITSGCKNVVENLSILVKKTLYPISGKLPSNIKDSNDMLNIVGSINEFVWLIIML